MRVAPPRRCQACTGRESSPAQHAGPSFTNDSPIRRNRLRHLNVAIWTDPPLRSHGGNARALAAPASPPTSAQGPTPASQTCHHLGGGRPLAPCPLPPPGHRAGAVSGKPPPHVPDCDDRSPSGTEPLRVARFIASARASVARLPQGGPSQTPARDRPCSSARDSDRSILRTPRTARRQAPS